MHVLKVQHVVNKLLQIVVLENIKIVLKLAVHAHKILFHVQVLVHFKDMLYHLFFVWVLVIQLELLQI